MACILAVAGLLATVGSDANWLAALGHLIAQQRSIPAGVPFAAAPSGQWPNVLVLAELVFSALERTLGDRGLVLAQLIAVGAAMTLLARGALAGGAAAVGASAALLLAALGSLPSLAIARVQLFSLILFPVLLLLLRAEAKRPSRRVWMVVPLMALWSNLHGAALMGLVVLFAYLGLCRLREQPRVAVGVAAAALGALCLTPALGGTLTYYDRVLTNVAAQRGQGLWGPLSVSAPLDLVMIACAVALAIAARRSKPQLWEVAVFGVLAGLTIHAARSGVWLLFFLVAPAARTITPARSWERLVPVAALAALAALSFAIVRGPISQGASGGMLARVVRLAQGSPVLASDEIAEQLALAGGRVWIADPIDAFTRRDQGVYLDWLQGGAAGREALTAQIRLVVVARRSAAQRLMDGRSDFSVVARDRTSTVYARAR